MIDESLQIPGLSGFELIGRGGQSQVFRAYHAVLDRQVAVKVVSLDLPHEARELAARRFATELRALRALGDHPHIVEVHDAGTTGSGEAYLIMAYYPLGTMADRITTHGPSSLASTTHVGVQIASALETAHAAGIVHRDVKPTNFLLTRHDDVVLSDFGIARFADQPATATHTVTATVAFAPPEVVAGGRYSPAGDIYALGVSLYTLAMGRSPFAADDDVSVVETLHKIANGDADVEGCPPELDRVLRRWIDLDPDRRPPADEARHQIADLSPLPMHARTAPSSPTGSIDRSTHPTLSAVAPTTPAARDAVPSTLPTRTVPMAGPPPPPPWAPPGAPLPPPPPGPPDAPPPPPAWAPSGAPPPPIDVPGVAARSSPPPSPAPETAPWPTSPRPVEPSPAAPPPGPPPGAWAPPPAPPPTVRRRLLRRAIRSSTSAPPPPTASPSGDLPFAFLSDRPCADDKLGYEPLVMGLARLLCDEATALPLTVGIAGRWGAGKSSVMLQLRDQLDRLSPDGRWIPVWFDVWRFQGRDAVWAGLARAIYRQSIGPSTPRHRRVALRIDLERRRHGTVRTLGAVAAIVAAAGFVGYMAWRATVTSGWASWTWVGTGVAAIAAIGSFLGLVSTPFERAVRRGSLTKQYDEHLGISDAAERDVGHLIDAVTRGGRRLVVFLDDIDRCSPSTIVETLTAVTEVFGREAGQRIVFVLGIDIDIVVAAINSALGDVRADLGAVDPRRADELGTTYLEKLFQVVVRLDGFGRAPVERLFAAGDDGPSPRGGYGDLTSRLAATPIANPSDVDDARRAVGYDTVTVPPEAVAAVRAAVRDRRATLLNAATSFDVKQAEVNVMAAVGMGPRAAKRFDNTFRLQLQVANGTEGCQLGYTADELLALAKWIAFRTHFPVVAARADREVGLLSELESLAVDLARPIAFRERLVEMGGQGMPTRELQSLLSVGGPGGAPMSTLPLDSFATIV